MIKKLILLLSIIFLLYSCEKSCNCTTRGCPCLELFISLQANVDNNIEGNFTEQDINDFYLFRTNDNYEIIDSLKINFKESSNDNYNRFFWITASLYSDTTDLRQYNFIIKNSILNTMDTISSISYVERLENVVCNRCGPDCDDTYVVCPVIYDFSLEFNCVFQNEQNIPIKKQQ